MLNNHNDELSFGISHGCEISFTDSPSVKLRQMHAASVVLQQQRNSFISLSVNLNAGHSPHLRASLNECCMHACAHFMCIHISHLPFYFLIFFFDGEWSFCWQCSNIKSRDGEEREPCNWTTVPFIICSRNPSDCSLQKYQLFGLVRLRLGLHLDQRFHAFCIMALIFHSSPLSGCEWSAGCLDEGCHQTHADAEPRGEMHTTPVRRLAPRQTEFVPVE